MEKPDIFGTGGTSFVSLEEIENAFKTPTQYQHYYEHPDASKGSQYEPSDDFPPELVDPDGSASHDYEQLPDETPHVDHEHAMRTGERIARLIDTGIDFALTNFVSKNGESYHADERDLQDIAEAWGEVSEEHNWNIGPEWTLAILYIMVYGPLVKQAFTDRRMAMIEERQKAMQAQIDMIKMQQAAQAQPAPQQQPEKTATNGTAANTDPKPSAFTYQPK